MGALIAREFANRLKDVVLAKYKTKTACAVPLRKLTATNYAMAATLKILTVPVARPPRLPVMAFASANHSSMPVVSVVVEIPRKILTLTPVSIWVESVCAVLSVETSLRNLVAMNPSIFVVLA